MFGWRGYLRLFKNFTALSLFLPFMACKKKSFLSLIVWEIPNTFIHRLPDMKLKPLVSRALYRLVMLGLFTRILPATWECLSDHYYKREAFKQLKLNYNLWTIPTASESTALSSEFFVEWLNTPLALYLINWLIAINTLRLNTSGVDVIIGLIFGSILLRLAIQDFDPPLFLVNSLVYCL